MTEPTPDQPTQPSQVPTKKADASQGEEIPLNLAAQALGRKGGKARSAAKTRAVRENGKRNAERIRALKAQQTPPDSTQQPPSGHPQP